MHKNWSRVRMDMTHFVDQHHLTLINCSPSKFAIWRSLLCQDSASIIQQLETVSYKRGLPVELLNDSGMYFVERCSQKFTEVWSIWMRFHCAYIPTGYGIIEKSCCTIKHIAAKSMLSHGVNILVQCNYDKMIQQLWEYPPTQYTHTKLASRALMLHHYVNTQTPHGQCSIQF